MECAHRRWGKDDVALRWSCCAAQERVGNYWHMLPQAEQGRKVIWTAINEDTGKKRIDEAFPGWLRSKTLDNEMAIEFTSGSRWQVVGSDNYNSIVGAPPVGLVFSEWALANPLAWAYLAPILERNGGWVLWIYTSRGHNHGLSMLRHAQTTGGWFAELNPADKTPVYTAKQLENIHHEYQRIFGIEMGDALFEQEYMCSFEGAQLGAYYGKAMIKARKDERICGVPHNPAFEVDTAWDLGVDDSMSIWFVQQIGRWHHFIDYYENTGYGLEHYAKALKGQLPGSEHRSAYTYGNHYMPHDAEASEMTSGEIAQTRKQVAENLGVNPVIVVTRAKNINLIVQVHIPAVRNILAQSRFDEVRCEQGLLALESYSAEYDEEKKVLGNRPAHTWASHASDAMRTYAVGYQERPSKASKDWRKRMHKGTWRSA